jgi:hypothetical protein
MVGKGRRFSLLAPTKDMHKQGYTKDEYFNLLDQRIDNPAEIYEQIEDKIICYWEKDGNKCHRRYVPDLRFQGEQIPTAYMSNKGSVRLLFLSIQPISTPLSFKPISKHPDYHAKNTLTILIYVNNLIH